MNDGSTAVRAAPPAGPQALLHPRSVAIIGASDRSRWSQGLFDNLRHGGFSGAVHLVNRRGGLVHGEPAATSCAAIGQPVDLGVVIVPAQAMEEALEDLAGAGVGAAIVLTSGFAETGPEGARRQEDLAAAARRHGIRLLGPNSLGLINFAGGATIWTTPVRAPSSRRGVAVLSQSGATALFLTNLAHQQDIGLSVVVATGNEADLDCTALVDALIDDPHTDALALFLETVRDPASFRRVAARALGRAKPLVVLKVGASEVTAKAATAHTGALVGDDRVFEGLCRQYGIIRVRSVEQLLVTAAIAGRTGVLEPGGLAVASNSGGICEIAADSAHLRGIALPALSAETLEALKAVLPDYGTPHNPLDLTGGFDPAQGEEAIRLLGTQPGVSAVLCPWYEVPTRPEDVSRRLLDSYAALSRGLKAAGTPGFLVSYTHAAVNETARSIVADMGLPYLACGLDRAVAGLADAFWWSERQRRRAEPPAGSAPPRKAAERPASEREALAFLGRNGVPVVPMRLAATADEAVAAWRGLGGDAAALKIASPDIAHKSDIGAVALGIQGEAAVTAAFDRIMANVRAAAPAARIDGVLVAPMRERGLELIVGASRDPQWGLVLAVGLGGVWVEVLRDVSLRVLPVTPADIRAMLAELRGAKLLSGHRDLPACDMDGLVAAIAAIAEAALSLGPDLAAMDVNPLWVRGSRIEALDALFVWDGKA